jgi:hypothetical protein
VLIQDQDYYSVVDFENDEEHIRRSFRAHQSMKTRIKKQNIEVGLKKIRLRELATSLELFELMRKSKGVCAVSGIRGSWTKSSNNPFFLTFDHINPISLGGHFSIDNVQILSHCLNQVKGNESNLELIRWLWCFQNSLKKRMNEVGLNGD